MVAALAQQALGHWDGASELLAKARAVDPRSVVTGWRLTRTLLFRRRYDEAAAKLAWERTMAFFKTELA